MIRDGEEQVVKEDEIMVGDLMVIKEGMEISADVIMVRGNSIKIDESPMTGETKPVKKDTLLNCIAQRDKIV